MEVGGRGEGVTHNFVREPQHTAELFVVVNFAFSRHEGYFKF